MILAIAVSRGRVAPLFDAARLVRLVHVVDGEVLGREERSLCCDEGLAGVACLCRWDVDLLICGAISRELGAALEARCIGVQSLVAGEVGQVERAFLDQSLDQPAFRMPGRP
jgi:predicted Fe-Mo cluster-binding NifX family protein